MSTTIRKSSWREKRKKRDELVSGAVISVPGIDGGPFKIHRVYWVDPELALSLIDSNNCRVSITTTISDFDYELAEGESLGPCGAY